MNLGSVGKITRDFDRYSRSTLDEFLMKTDYLDLPNSLPIADLCFRRFRDAEDFPKMLTVVDDAICCISEFVGMKFD